MQDRTHNSQVNTRRCLGSTRSVPVALSLMRVPCTAIVVYVCVFILLTYKSRCPSAVTRHPRNAQAISHLYSNQFQYLGRCREAGATRGHRIQHRRFGFDFRFPVTYCTGLRYIKIANL